MPAFPSRWNAVLAQPLRGARFRPSGGGRLVQRPAGHRAGGRRRCHPALHHRQAVRDAPLVVARQALAWRQGGLAGLELLRAEWDPAAEDPDAAGLLEAARAVLRAKTGAADVVVGNRVTAGRLQLRLGRDLRWYPYARSDQDWEPSGAPKADPALAVADL